jgi:hypothetical protein
MDPNAALARLRQLSKEIDALDLADETPDIALAAQEHAAALAEEFAQVFDGLDHWLSIDGANGMFPHAWGRRAW